MMFLQHHRQLPPFLHRLLHSTITTNHQHQRGIHLEEVSSMACRLTSRAVIKIHGPDTIKFLQGLLTNDVKRLVSTAADASQTLSSYLPTSDVSLTTSPSMYNAVLTSQGRFLYDLFIYRPSLPHEDLLYADVGVDVADELLDSIKRYRLRSKVEIQNVAEEFTCWQRFGGKLVANSSSARVTERASESLSDGNNFGYCWYQDPRLECLGFRGIFPSDTIPPLVEYEKKMDEDCYLLWRLERGVAEGSIEIPKGSAIPHEFNLAGLNAISFDKGCYVGQEFVARTHHRGIIRKRLVPMKFTNENEEEVKQRVTPGMEVVEAISNKKAGTISTVFGCHGMGVLRLKDAMKSSLVIKDHPDIMTKVTLPEWWPSEWTQELEQ